MNQGMSWRNGNWKCLSPTWGLPVGCGGFWLGMALDGWPLFCRILLVIAGGMAAAAVLPPVLRKVQRGHAGIREWIGLAAAAGTLWFHPLFWIPVGGAVLCEFLQRCFGGGYGRWAAALMGAFPLTCCAWYAWAYEWSWTGTMLLFGSWFMMILVEGASRWRRDALWRFSYWFWFWTAVAAAARAGSSWRGKGVLPAPELVTALVVVCLVIALASWRMGRRSSAVAGRGIPPAARGFLAGYGMLSVVILGMACFPWLRGSRGFEWKEKQYETTAETFQPFCAALVRYWQECGEWPETPGDLRQIGFTPDPWEGRLLDFFVDGDECRFLVRIRFYLEPLSGMMTAETGDLVRWRICSPRPVLREWTTRVGDAAAEIESGGKAGKDDPDGLTRRGDVL